MRQTTGPRVKRGSLLPVLLLGPILISGPGFAPAAKAAPMSPSLKVTCQGIFAPSGIRTHSPVPEGIRPEAGVLRASGGRRVIIETPDTRTLPSRVRISEVSGRVSFDRLIPLLSDPVMSPGGRYLALRSGNEILVIDVLTSDVAAYENGSPFAVGSSGELAFLPPTASPEVEEARSVVLTRAGLVEDIPLPLGERVHKIGFEPDGRRLLLMADQHLHGIEIESLDAVVLFSAPPGWRLRDLRVEDDGTCALGFGRITDGYFEGGGVHLDRAGRVLERFPVVRELIPVAHDLPQTSRGIPWPLTFNQQYPIGNTYGEFQDYGGAPYMHPGVDIMGAEGEPIFAVEAGWVKAILTTSGSYHWRVAIGDTPSGYGEGYLYAHLEQGSIAVQVGDYVGQGTYLGGLVWWPVAGFTHVHFARISDSGTQWYGNWLNTDNPHLDLENLSENDFPVFEPAAGSNLLAFCQNETSSYLDPSALHGEVDIIAHIGDQLWDDWVCTVQEIRYSIYPVGNPGNPIVDHKLGIYYDMVLDTYQGGPIDPMMVDLFYKQDGTCSTQGDYDYREFYYIITNSNGDLIYEESDFDEAWNTTHSPDGDYIVRVTALDAAGNATVDSMVVTTANGSSDAPLTEPRFSLGATQPNPTLGASRIQLRLATPHDVMVGVFDSSGRLVRHLSGGLLGAGDHTLTWDGRDAGGLAVPPGMYFYRLQSGEKAFERKVVVF